MPWRYARGLCLRTLIKSKGILFSRQSLFYVLHQRLPLKTGAYFQHESDGRTKEDVFDLLLAAKADVDALMKGVQYTESSRVEDQVGSWMRWLRAGDNIPRADPGELT